MKDGSIRTIHRLYDLDRFMKLCVEHISFRMEGDDAMIMENFFELGEDHFEADRPIFHFAASRFYEAEGVFEVVNCWEKFTNRIFDAESGHLLSLFLHALPH